MKIILAASTYPPETGGSAYYAKALFEQLKEVNISVDLAIFSKFLSYPSGIRHLMYFFSILKKARKGSTVIVLDTFSAALPAVLASKVVGCKSLIRIGGDFLWESFSDSSPLELTLEEFYKINPMLKLKQKCIRFLTHFIVKNADALAFNSLWQKNIWERHYKINKQKTFFVENAIDKKVQKKEEKLKDKLFLNVARDRKIKNLDRLRRVFKDAEVSNQAKLVAGPASFLDMQKGLNSCYVAILPSISDVSPDFVIKALSYNKPVIVTKHNGLAEDIKAVIVQVEPRSEDSIKKAAKQMLNSDYYQKQKRKVENFNRVRGLREVAQDFASIVKVLEKQNQ